MLNKEKRENYEKISEYSFIKGNIELDEQKLDQLLHLEENFDLLKREFDMEIRGLLFITLMVFVKMICCRRFRSFFWGLMCLMWRAL